MLYLVEDMPAQLSLRRIGSRIQCLLGHDFFPHFSVRVRSTLKTPLGVLLLAIAVGVLCGLVLHPRLFLLVDGLAAVVTAGVCWPWATVRGTTARAEFERSRAAEGESVGLRITITNALPWPAWGLNVREPSEDSSALAWRVAALSGRARLSFRCAFIAHHRGSHPRSPLVVATGLPFGIWEASRRVPVAAPLLIWPRTFPVGPVPDVAAADVPDGNVARNKVGTNGDVVGVRPYRYGDSPRRVHWAQTARHDRLIVRELQSVSRPVVFLWLDADPAVHSPGPDGSREWAIRVVASLARGWLEAGAQVGAGWGGERYAPASGAGQATRILDGLARLPDDRPTWLPDGADLDARDAVVIAVTSDAGLQRLPPVMQSGVRWCILNRAGFGGPPAERSPSCDEGPPRARPRPWLEFGGPASVPALLRAGWSEARHGS